MTALLLVLLSASVAGLTLHFGGLAGLVYVLLYALALAPGLPAGWRLFGQQSPLGWVAGALAGYGLTSLAIWATAWMGLTNRLAFAAAWGVVAVAAWRLWTRWRSRPPLVATPAWRPIDTQRGLLFLACVLVFFAIPYARVGETDAAGSRLYRSYFTADFVWHMAMTEELARFEFPPTNPYLAPEPIHYYWTYFLVPAAIAGPESARLLPVEGALEINALGTAILMFGAIFLGAWGVTGRSGAALAASLLALMAPSWEGLYTLHDLWTRGVAPSAMLQEVRQLNIDAVTNWRFQGLRIDGLVRSMWWTPQHATSFSAGLVALATAGLASHVMSRQVSVAIGGLLTLSVVMNPFLGAAFCLMHGLVVSWAIVTRQWPWRVLIDQLWTVVPVAIGLGWTVLNQMGGGAGDAVTIGWRGLGRNAPVKTMLLSLGGLFVPAALCMAAWVSRRTLGSAWVAIPGVLVAVALGWFVSLTDIAWVGFRAGNLLQVTLPMLAAVGIAALFQWSRAASVGLVSLLLVAGAPTTVIDTFNAQDLENRAMGPGFHWVIPISPAQQAGFRWLRDNAPLSAIVQADPVVRGRENWSLIPSFAGRRMAAGDPISLLATPAYAERSSAVHHLYVAAPPAEAHAIALRLGISFLWFDQDDDAAAADRLQAAPQFFPLVFRRERVRILAVAGAPDGGPGRP